MITFLNGLRFFFAGVMALALILGYLTSYLEGMGYHMVTGLLGVAGGLLALCLDMFFLIGTGARVKEAAQAKLIEGDDYHATRKFKGIAFPMIMGVIVLLIAMPALGAGYHAGKFPIIWHHIVAWVTLVLYIAVSFKIRTILKENAAIFERTVEAVNAAHRSGAGHEQE